MNETLKVAIENYLQGDENAFSIIYEESNRYIYANLKSILKNDEDMINDVMQDTYLEISKNLKGLENVESFLPWAKTISTRKAYRALKKAGKYVLLGEDESFDDLSDNNMLPEEVVLSKEKQEKVREVINTELTEDEKNCVVGFYYNDMKQKDIAKELDMPENTVKSNIFRAKSKMKKALSGVFVVALAACLLIFALNTNAVKEALRKIGYNKEEAQTKATEESSEQASEVEEPSVVEEFGKEIIPEGCQYHSAKTNKTYLAGEKFLKTLSDGDYLLTADYMYIRTEGIWKLKVDNTNKREYEAIMPTIAGEPLVSMASTFADCTQLIKAPVIPDTVTNMSATFQGCTSLVEAPVIPETVTDMSYTFSGCKSLVEAPVIPETVTDMSYTFSGCKSLVKAPELPKTIINLYDTFEGCESLVKAPVIPELVEGLGGTFSGCTSLVEAPVIPKSVTNMGGAFRGCTSLVEAPVIPESVDNLASAFEGCTSLVEAPVIPKSVVELGLDWTFYGCTSLVKAPVIPELITRLNSTFYGCTSLVEAPAIPKLVEGLPSTFEGCTSLVKAPVIPESVTSMNATFAGCTSLTGDIIINASPDNYEDCFKGVRIVAQKINLSGSSTLLSEIKDTGAYSIVVPEVIGFYDESEDKTTVYDGDFIFYPSYEFANDYTGDKIITRDYEYTCEAEATLIEYGVWTVKVKDITKEKYEDIIGIIGSIDLSGTFAGCTNMKEAPSFGDEVIRLKGTFAGCTSLIKAPNIPDVANLERTFEGCTSIESASVIPSTVVCLYRTFAGCTNLTGTVVIDSNPIIYNECFYGLDFSRQNLTIKGESEKLADIKLTTDKIEANKNVLEYGDVIKVSCRMRYISENEEEWVDKEDKEFVVNIDSISLWTDLTAAIGKTVGESFVVTEFSDGVALYECEYTILEIIKSE
ncbi:MAG: sigma-70 family RNA polymerase sigma factor [Lachnospira sp.]|nr:sigma-70 family RNA polymerase sigma factor [Lachnospira sp.]